MRATSRSSSAASRQACGAARPSSKAPPHVVRQCRRRRRLRCQGRCAGGVGGCRRARRQAADRGFGAWLVSPRPVRRDQARAEDGAHGTFGEFHPKTLETLDVSGPICGFEVYLDAIPEAKAKPTRTKPRLDLSAFQAVKRDFAFVVDRAVEAATLVKAATGADKKLIAGVSVFDVFEGAALGEGKKSVAIEVSIQPTERTLTDEDFEALSGRIVENVKKQTGGVLRG